MSIDLTLPPARDFSDDPRAALGSFRHRRWLARWPNSLFLCGQCGFVAEMNGFDWVRFVAPASRTPGRESIRRVQCEVSVSIERLVEIVTQDRTFSDIFGHSSVQQAPDIRSVFSCQRTTKSYGPGGGRFARHGLKGC
jgi:hypothetical protein